MRHALVTGAAGVFGREVVELLLEHGFRVRATDLASADRRKLNARADFVPSDLRLPSTLRKLFDGVSRCYHLAELSDPAASFVELYNTNVIGTRNLLRSSLPHKKKINAIIVRSSVGVYGPAKGGLYTEDRFLDPKDDFHKTMAAREEAALDFEMTLNLPVVVLRTAPIYNEARKWKKGASVHVHDAARAAHFLSDRSGLVGDIFHLADEESRHGLDIRKIRALGFTLDYPKHQSPEKKSRSSSKPGIGSV